MVWTAPLVNGVTTSVSTTPPPFPKDKKKLMKQTNGNEKKEKKEKRKHACIIKCERKKRDLSSLDSVFPFKYVEGGLCSRSALPLSQWWVKGTNQKVEDAIRVRGFCEKKKLSIVSQSDGWHGKEGGEKVRALCFGRCVCVCACVFELQVLKRLQWSF